jgi:hypothetical protein
MIDKSIAEQLAKEGQAQLRPAAAPAPNFEPPEPQSEHSADVDNNLNQADMAFQNKWEDTGCQFVANAITSASRGISEDQSRQLQAYAQRCGLRY